jgi:hypothetical protein
VKEGFWHWRFVKALLLCLDPQNPFVVLPRHFEPPKHCTALIDLGEVVILSGSDTNETSKAFQPTVLCSTRHDWMKQHLLSGLFETTLLCNTQVAEMVAPR